MEALIIVDVQNDFCPGGALGVDEGDRVVEPLNRLAAEHALVVATRDWHPPEHGSFVEKGGPWPPHCIQETPGAELHSGLELGSVDLVLDKGQDPDTDGYSAFDGTGLERFLRQREVERVHVGGLAFDYCVKHTALDARRYRFAVVVHREATRAVNVEPGDDARTEEDLRKAGVEIAS